VRRSAFLDVGGFDDVEFFGGEEERVALDLAAADWGLAFVPDLVVHHHPSPNRDPGRRAVQQARNRVVTAVLRRRWRTVGAVVRDALWSGPVGRAGVRAALARLPRALRARRRLPPAVEAARAHLEGRDLSRARSHRPGRSTRPSTASGRNLGRLVWPVADG
jgi:GT2 family glycosyltransferase